MGMSRETLRGHVRDAWKHGIADGASPTQPEYFIEKMADYLDEAILARAEEAYDAYRVLERHVSMAMDLRMNGGDTLRTLSANDPRASDYFVKLRDILENGSRSAANQFS